MKDDVNKKAVTYPILAVIFNDKLTYIELEVVSLNSKNQSVSISLGQALNLACAVHLDYSLDLEL